MEVVCYKILEKLVIARIDINLKHFDCMNLQCNNLKVPLCYQKLHLLL